MIEQIENDTLVDYLRGCESLYTKNTIDAFYSINRADFMTQDAKDFAFIDSAVPIGYSQTISQPRVVAFMLELLKVKKGDFVLDIGSGSGYTTALLSKMTGKYGSVTGVERVSELIEFGQNNLKKYDITNAKIIPAFSKLGLEDETFDRILVSAAADDFPKELLDQLKEGGRIVIPIRNSIFMIEKKDGEINREEYQGFVFVPLIYD